MKYVKTCVAVLTALAVATLSLAGCGGSASGQSGNDSDTITIGSLGPVTGPDMHIPQARAGMKAAIASINSAGGVNGHPLKLDFCDTKFDPNEAASCARQLVEDQVSAVVGPGLFFYPNSSLPALEKAGIPIIASQGTTAREYQSPVTFPLAGEPGWFYGAVSMLLERGASRISVIGIGNSASSFANQLVGDAVEAAGLHLAHNVAVPPNAVDLAPAVNQAIAGGVDGVVLATSPQMASKAVSALKSTGYGGLIASVTDLFPQESITALGAKSDGILLVSLAGLIHDKSNPSSRKFLEEMKKYQPDTEKLDQLAYVGWAATHLFAKVASGLSSYDAESVLAKMKNLDQVDIPAFGGFATKGVDSPIKNLPQLLHTKVLGTVIKNGEIVSIDGFFDPFEKIEMYKENSR